MKAVFDPKGGYFKAGGVYMPSLVAELGSIVEDHLKSIGMIHDPEMSPERRALIAEKRAAFENRSKKKPDAPVKPTHGRPSQIEDNDNNTVTSKGNRLPTPAPHESNSNRINIKTYTSNGMPPCG